MKDCTADVLFSAQSPVQTQLVVENNLDAQQLISEQLTHLYYGLDECHFFALLVKQEAQFIL